MKSPSFSDHYAVLGLDHGCSVDQIRSAYRLLAKQLHPDLNPEVPEAILRSQELNAAYEILGDPARRLAYDRELAEAKKEANPRRAGTIERNISQEVHLKIQDFLRGTALEVHVKDPANAEGPETYPLDIPAGTAPGTRFRLPRAGRFAGGWVEVRVRVLPDFRFKVRGSDLRCDLRIKLERAAQGGTETIQGASGSLLRVQIPRGAARGEIVSLPGEGLPKPRGGRGNLLVRITYRPEVRITRAARQ